MQLYLRYFPDSYHELITYYPRFYKEVLEMDAILHTHGWLLDGLQDSIERVYLDAFVSTADEETITIWEDLLGLTYAGSPTLEQRRSAVIAWLLGNGHIGEPEIREIIAQYTDHDVAIDYGTGIIYITIDGEVFDETSLLNTLAAKIPAHLALNTEVHVTRSFRCEIPFGFVGMDEAYIRGTPPDVHKVQQSTQRGVGGVYCRSHTTSKLIS